MEFGTILIVIGIISLFVLEAFFEVAFFSLLGTSVRWVFYRKEKKFNDLYRAKTKINLFVGIVTFVTILAVPFITFAILNN